MSNLLRDAFIASLSGDNRLKIDNPAQQIADKIVNEASHKFSSADEVIKFANLINHILTSDK